jgi:hypothetical protein
MATKVVNLKFDLTTQGIDKARKELERLNASMSKVKEATSQSIVQANKVKRAQDGTAQRTGNMTKDFARQAQGLGGLVQAYATVAANVFALSSAFLVLRRSADLSSMIKSAEDFSNRFGVSVVRITRQMQEASGGALSFAEALPTINKAISAGIGVDKLEQLTIAATKASQTFGGTATEALNRFISASQRGRVEIIQTLGIVIKTEQAYKDYGATIGKTALELTAADRQVAILNATIKESQNIFDRVNIDPNPFQQLLTTIIDVKDTMSTFITDALTPMINAFNKSKNAAIALIAIIASMVGGRIFPEISNQIAGFAKSGLESTKLARQAAISAQEASDKVTANADKQITSRKLSSLKKETAAFDAALKAQGTAHKSFTKELFDNEKKLNVAVLTERRAALARNQKLLDAGKPGLKGLPGVSAAGNAAQANVLNLIAINAKNANIAVKNVGKTLDETATRAQVFGAKATAAMAKFKATVIGARSAFKTGFAQGFSSAQVSILDSLNKMRVGWAIFIRDIAVGTAKSGSHLANFSKAVGRTAAVVAGSFARIVSAATSITLAVSIGLLVWEKYGDKIRGITPEMRAVINAGEEFDDALEEVNERTAEGIVLLGNELPKSLKKLQDALKFTAGTFASITSAITNFQKVVVKGLNNLSPNEAINRLKEAQEEVKKLRSEYERTEVVRRGRTIGQEKPTDAQVDAVRELNSEIVVLTNTLKILSDEIGNRFIDSFTEATKLAERVGFENIGEIFKEEFEKSLKQGLGAKIPVPFDTLALQKAFESGDIKNIKTELKSIEEAFGDDIKAFGAFSFELLSLVSNFNSVISDVSSTTDRALGSLRDVDSRITTFVGGLDKLKAASGPNKEISAFILDITNELKVLDDNQKSITKNANLSSIFGDPKELAQIKALIGANKDEFVSIGDALQLGIDLQDILLKQDIARLVGTEKLKILSTQLNSIKAREIKTDQQRLDQVRDTLDAERRITQLKLDNAVADQNAQNAKVVRLQGLNASPQTLRIEQAIADTLEAEVNSLVQKQDIQKSNLPYLEEELKLRAENLASLEKTNKTVIQILKLNQSRTSDFITNYKIRKDIFEAEKIELKLQKQALNVQIERAKLQNDAGPARDRAIAPLQAQLALLEAQTYELQQQALILAAGDLQSSGTDLTAEGMTVLGHIMTEEIHKGVRNLAPTLVTLGKGFADAVNGTVDSAVDKLLEGHGFNDFAHAVQEALKDGLRTAFGDALKNAIKNNIAGLFPKLSAIESPEAKAARIQAENAAKIAAISQQKLSENTTSVDLVKEEIMTQTTATMDNTTALENCTKAFAEGCGGKVNTATPKLQDANVMVSTDKAKADVEEGNAILDNIASESTELNKGIKLVADAVADTGNTTAAAMVTLGGQILSVLSLSGGGTGSGEGGGVYGVIGSILGGIIGFAKGGIMNHSNIRSLADGAVTKGPELALIGEGKNDEAVVPLPNNRAIPVELRGAGGDTINIEQHFDFRNADTNAIPQLRAEARAIEDRTFNRVFSEINKGGKYAKMVGRR